MQNYLISTLLAVTHYSVYVGHIGQILLLIKFFCSPYNFPSIIPPQNCSLFSVPSSPPLMFQL